MPRGIGFQPMIQTNQRDGMVSERNDRYFHKAEKIQNWSRDKA